MTTLDLRARQRRVVSVLVVAQVFGGVSAGAAISVGALLAERVSGLASLSGMASTATTLGAALLAIPLARLAQRSGRRIALGTGSAISLTGSAAILVAASVSSFPLLLLAFALVGSGTAVNLQARFAATDLADPRHRARDLSLVIWTTTIGSVAGPNLVAPGERLGASLGLPELTGPFVIAASGQLLAVLVYAVLLRPDPLLLSRSLDTRAPISGETRGGTDAAAPATMLRRTRFGLVALALSHATMVSVMAMTPVHLTTHGAALTVVGVTLSLHIAGMYVLSPVFGWLADRVGRVPVIVGGQLVLGAALLATGVGSEAHLTVTIGLVLLGLGWSASTIGASALIAESAAADRTRVQGRSDLVMNLAGALGGASAGLVLGVVGYAGLSAAAGVLVLVVLALAPAARAGDLVDR